MMMQPIRLELPTGLPVATVNSYLFTDPEPVLIDSGVKSPESWDALVRGLQQHGLAVADLSRVIITHAHIDHYGQAGAIADHSAADIWISDLGLPWLQAPAEQWARRSRFYSDYFLPALGLPESAARAILSGIQAMESLGSAVPAGRLRTFAVDGTLDLGGRSWQVLHTPGHASMQTCFYEPEQKLLLSADMLLATTPTPVVESPADGSFNRAPALPRFMESLDLVQALAVEQVLPGHGRPFTDHQRVIDRQRARILARKQECLEWITAGYHTVSDLLDQMYAHQPLQFRFAGLWMLIGYLDLLEAGGQIKQQSLDGIWHYTPASPTM
jgi:glyoxylase-like metal-dependent hydrolase (beta-lactamase superfamily II)